MTVVGLMMQEGRPMAKNSQGASKTTTSPRGSVTRVEIDEEKMQEAVDTIWESMDEDASFADFEEAALAAGNELVRSLLKKRSKA